MQFNVIPRTNMDQFYTVYYLRRVWHFCENMNSDVNLNKIAAEIDRIFPVKYICELPRKNSIN